MKQALLKLSGIALLAVAFGAVCAATPAVPEIDPASGANAIALVAGALLIIRSRR